MNNFIDNPLNGTITWSFPGGTTGLILAALTILVIIILSYSFTLRRLSPGKRILFALMRLAVLGGLLACAADIRLEKRRQHTIDVPEKLYVAFDTSSSMTQPGIVGGSRLENAIKLWRDSNLKAEIFGFDTAVSRYNNIAELARYAAGKNVRNTDMRLLNTELAASLNADGTPARLVIFTDAVDTMTAEPVQPTAPDGSLNLTLVKADTELFARSRAGITRLESPTRQPLNTAPEIHAVAAYSRLLADDRLEFIVRNSNNEILQSSIVSRRASDGAAVFSTFLPGIAQRGTADYRIELYLNDKMIDAAEWSITSRENSRRKLLIWHDSYDWAIRFFRNAFERNRASRIDMTVGHANDKLRPARFPDRKELATFDAVMLLNVNGAGFSEEIFTELDEYVKNGGGLLLVTGTPASAAEFAGSRLETFLPVEFKKFIPDARLGDTKTKKFRESMAVFRDRPDWMTEERFVESQEGTFQPRPMQKFSLTKYGKNSTLFQRNEGEFLYPQCFDVATVADLKPGAVALATVQNVNGEETTALAVQRYGRGRTAVLATDPLWHWKLQLPSEANDFEQFWENMVNFLAETGRSGGGWQVNELLYKSQTPITATFSVDGGNNAVDYSYHLQSATADVVLTPEFSADGRNAVVTTAPLSSGIYRLSATPLNGEMADREYIKITVYDGDVDSELAQLGVNTAYFAQAERFAGVKILTLSDLEKSPELLSGKNPATTQTVFTDVRSDPLWWRWWIITAITAIYLTELIMRRREGMV